MGTPQSERLFSSRSAIAITGVLLAVTLLLWSQGRVWWCQVADYVPWSWNIWSMHNSQHLIDPYSFTHILHGVLEFWLVSLIFGKLPLRWRLVMAVMIEATWECVENSTYMIERYRADTISVDYFGDSIINSLSDIACCATGFVLGYKLGFWRSAVLFVTTELVLILTIRDSLVINIVMLIHKFDAIKHWQMGM